MNVICDTNAITALRLGNERVVKILDAADTVFLSVIVLGELRAGYKNGSKQAQNEQFLEAFLAVANVQTLPVNAETSGVYSELFIALKKLGKPIPTNDLWIAAQAIETGAVLLTRDDHFSPIVGLRRDSF